LEAGQQPEEQPDPDFAARDLTIFIRKIPAVVATIPKEIISCQSMISH